MVCPQEQYSLEAMRAFSDSRQFLGLICTACMPRDLASPQICGADLLLPAQDSFFGFPVFKRHYSGNMAVFAMALFLGKPAILVEHHEFFRNGPGAAEKICGDCRTASRSEMETLVETVTRTHARRRVSEGTAGKSVFHGHVSFGTWIGRADRISSAFGGFRKRQWFSGCMVEGKEVHSAERTVFLSFETHAHRPRTMTVRWSVSSHKTHQSLFIWSQIPGLRGASTRAFGVQR